MLWIHMVHHEVSMLRRNLWQQRHLRLRPPQSSVHPAELPSGHTQLARDARTCESSLRMFVKPPVVSWRWQELKQMLREKSHRSTPDRPWRVHRRLHAQPTRGKAWTHEAAGAGRELMAFSALSLEQPRHAGTMTVLTFQARKTRFPCLHWCDNGQGSGFRSLHS